MPVDLSDLFKPAKALVARPRWRRRPDNNTIIFTAPLDVDGVTVEGLRLRGTALFGVPDRDVVFQLEYHGPNGEGGPLCRCEWRPIPSHSNKGLGPPELRFMVQRASHHHCFHLNWGEVPRLVRRGKLPIAVPIEPDPASFDEFLAIVGREFRIENIGLVERPHWVGDML